MKPSGPSLWRALTTSAEVAEAVEYCDLSTEALGYLWDQLKVHLEWLRSCGLGSPGLDNIRSHIGYTLPCDRRNRVPYWVFEHLTRES